MAKSYSWAPVPAYKVTKAALNMLTTCYALDLGKEGFTVFPLTPGVGSVA
jgi:NAD(P)-dependent dehydrogenase (short-subunit alcohol dehydrogenase family)